MGRTYVPLPCAGPCESLPAGRSADPPTDPLPDGPAWPMPISNRQPPTYPFPTPYLNLSLSLSYPLESLISSFVTPSKKGVGNALVLPNVSSHDSKLCEISQSSVHNSSKHASFFENKLRETIIKVWNNNFMSSISHRFYAAINVCGTNLLSTSEDC